jgi:hypothetical protein
MDGPKTTLESTAPAAAGKNERGARRRRWEMTPADVRYFLPKSGTTIERPDLGREMPSEGDALVEAFRTGQVMYTLVAWKAVPELDDDAPRIVKQALNRS